MSMENDELLRRTEDLADRASRRGSVTSTGFLTPAEQYALRAWSSTRPDVPLVLTGGQEGCERQAAFFLPDWLPAESFEPAEHIRAVRVEAHFGEPGHRDYMGAALGLGIQRPWLGDIRIDGATAYLFCLPSVEPLLLEELTKVGRCGVTAAACALSAVPAAERRLRRLSFTVKSLRLDAVTGELFGLSRTAAAELIRAGGVSLNYAECLRVDAPVREGDVISLRGHGKGAVTALGGRSRKDRLFVEAELWL